MKSKIAQVFHKPFSSDKKYAVWLVLGDSITEFNHCSEGYENYILHMRNYLRLKYGCGKFVTVDSAVSGRRLTDEVELLDEKLQRFTPDICTVMFGMNDSSAGEAGLKKFTDALNKAIDIFEKNNVPVIFLTQNPIDFTCQIVCIQNRKAYPQYVAKIVQVCKKRKVACLDIYSTWEEEILKKDPNEHFKLLHDGIHPNHKGHEFFFKVISEKMLN